MTADATGHSYFRRDPIVKRKPFAWPTGATVACAVIVSAEYYEMQPPADAFIPPNVPGGFGRGPYPDFRNYSARAYGNRVGIYRILEALDQYNIKASVAFDALTATLCPQLLPHISRRGLEIIAHGQSATRVISSRMSEAQEREYIRSTLETIKAATGISPAGWHGPEYGESARTPALLAEQGIQYLLDWPNDEQPITMTTQHGRITSVPMLIDLDDVYAQTQRKLTPARWRQCIEHAVERMIADGPDGHARAVVINLHPWLSGHPFRIGHVEALFETLAQRDDIWLDTPGKIAACWAAEDHS